MTDEGPFANVKRRDVWRGVLTSRAAPGLTLRAGRIIERAHKLDLGTGSLDDIEHVVLLMQENRSFDHYYGTMSGVRGFDDTSPGAAAAFRQRGYTPGKGPDPDGYVNPFRFNTRGPHLDGEVINDPTHNWGPQHRSWNGGAMDQWVTTHLEHDGPANGAAVMGYYERADIPVHRALADAFTICDHYFCSVLGPTNPNRLYWMTGTIDPDGKHGGPLVRTPLHPEDGIYSWRTYPEQLEDAGVSWKIYQNQGILQFLERPFLSGMMQQFKAYDDDHDSPLWQKACETSYPDDFARDVKDGTLPAVSWLIPSLLTCEHPALPPAEGAIGILHVLNILLSNPGVWAKTALIVSYDENGGLFDHVAPPTPPPGTEGEYITVPVDGVEKSDGIAGPIGLGFRVPGLVISPYSRGGLVCSDVFDHTSQLRFCERRFGVEAPNLSAWRRETCGDLTTAFDFARSPGDKLAPITAPKWSGVRALIRGNINLLLATLDRGKPYPIPANRMPTQEKLPVRRAPRGLP